MNLHMDMMWILLATGFTGGLTFVYYARWLWHKLVTPPSVTVFYSPKGGCTDAVVSEIRRARREVLIQAYSFTSKPIADALIEARGRGVHVEVLLDRSNEQETTTELGYLLEKGVSPLIDAQHAIAHNKIMILDHRTIITGSFNFTHQAEHENAENLLIIKGHRTLAQAYQDQFHAHKAHCQTPGATSRPTTATSRKAA